MNAPSQLKNQMNGRPGPDDQQQGGGRCAMPGADGRALVTALMRLVFGFADLLLGQLDLTVGQIGDVVDQSTDQLGKVASGQRPAVGRVRRSMRGRWLRRGRCDRRGRGRSGRDT